MIARPPGPSLFPYTTLFRSRLADQHRVVLRAPGQDLDDALDLLLAPDDRIQILARDRKSTRLNSSHGSSSYAVFCFKKKNMRCGRWRHYRPGSVRSPPSPPT